MIWSNAMMLRLAALRTSTKLSFHGIAAALNAEFNADLTTNACIGMAHRIGLPRHDGKVRKMRPASKPKRIKVRVDAPIAPRLSVRSLEPTPLLIEQLRDGDCKWPLGHVDDRPPYQYCGQAAPVGASYCPAHAERASSTPRKVLA